MANQGKWQQKKQEVEVSYPSVIEGIKSIYATKVKPVEELYKFETFHSPLLRDSDFDANPMVLLLGQYSTGKTTFVKYLLEGSFPGAHIGPEPTTDRFMAIFHGQQDMQTPGNALCVQADKPFRGLEKFGNDFLSKFQGSQTRNPVLEDLTFIDTPGVLSGEKQRVGRTYEFTTVTEWFAERSDMILLLFDAHKLDISDEFKRAIEALRGNDDKIRVVLNKSDMVSKQQLMRVYGALMWSLGKVLQTPEVVRVYVSSFPYDDAKNAPAPYNPAGEENYGLFDAEKADLLNDLFALPKYAALRKVNELVKRARLAKTHAYLISTLREQMPALMGKKKKQDELIANLKDVYFMVHKRWNCPVGDFPNLRRMQERLTHCEFSKFAKLDNKLISAMEQVLGDDIPKLMKRFPQENVGNDNPYASSNPFEGGGVDESAASPRASVISQEDRIRWANVFNALNPHSGQISGGKARPVMEESGLSRGQLSMIWKLSDHNGDGFLSMDEFIVCMWLLRHASTGNALPETWAEIPASVRNEPEEVELDNRPGDPFGGPAASSPASRPAQPAPSAAADGPEMPIAKAPSAFMMGADDPWPDA